MTLESSSEPAHLTVSPIEGQIDRISPNPVGRSLSVFARLDAIRQNRSFRNLIPAARQIQMRKNEINVIKKECAKCLDELNREVALYASMTFGLGCRSDSQTLRLQLRGSRGRINSLVTSLKNQMQPHLTTSGSGSAEEMSIFEKLWIAFISCMELIVPLLERSLILSEKFRVGKDNQTSIKTGLIEPLIRRRHTCIVQSMDMDLQAAAERDNLSLKSDIQENTKLLNDMIALVDYKPWAIEPKMEDSKYDCKSNYSFSEVSHGDDTMGESGTLRTSSRKRRRKRRIAMAAVGVLICLAVIVSIGTCIAYFTK